MKKILIIITTILVLVFVAIAEPKKKKPKRNPRDDKVQKVKALKIVGGKERRANVGRPLTPEGGLHAPSTALVTQSRRRR